MYNDSLLYLNCNQKTTNTIFYTAVSYDLGFLKMCMLEKLRNDGINKNIILNINICDELMTDEAQIKFQLAVDKRKIQF